MTAPRPLRRDAEANRQRVLRAAAGLFAERGLEVTLDDVAAEAGVGVGTVYRRFPDKAALVEALFLDRVEQMAGLAEDAVCIPDPWDALVTFMRGALEQQIADRGLAQLLNSGFTEPSRVTRARERIAPAVEALVTRARASGQLRPDIETTDIALMQMMVASVGERVRSVAPDAWRRYSVLLIDSLRACPGPPSPLPAPPMSFAEFERVLATVLLPF